MRETGKKDEENLYTGVSQGAGEYIKRPLIGVIQEKWVHQKTFPNGVKKRSNSRKN